MCVFKQIIRCYICEDFEIWRTLGEKDSVRICMRGFDYNRQVIFIRKELNELMNVYPYSYRLYL